MKHSPPRWADRFLAWYCRHDLLEEIQGDVYELYGRTAKESKRKADLTFIWNVLRFFRLKNIRRNKKNYTEHQISLAMLRNIFIVAIRNFFRQPGHSVLNVLGLAIGFSCAFLVLVWVTFEFSFNNFHPDGDKIYNVSTHIMADGNVQSYNIASVAMDVSSVSEVEKISSVSTGSRWPHTLCFRPEGEPKECIYLNGVYATENLFSMFNFPIIKGDQNPIHEPNAIAVSEKMAAMLFDTPDVIGKTIKIDDFYEVTIAAVFQNVPVNSSLQFDFAMPYAIVKKMWGSNDEQFKLQFFNVYLKTHQPVSSELLTDKLNDVRVVTEAYKAQNVHYQAIPLSDWRLKNKFENGKQAGGRIEYVVLFIIIGSLVLLMAVINFVSMTTARATTRAKEIGIRKATGAFRSSIIFQFLGESFLIVLAAFLLACLITQFSLPVFNSLLGEQINIDLLNGWVPAYLAGFLLIVALLAGLYPAFVMSSFQTVKILKGQLSDKISSSQRMRKFLLVAQLSISIGIIIFCSVLYIQLDYVTQKNLGFDRENMIRVEPTARLFRNFDAFKNELTKNSSITHVAAANGNPLNSGGSNTGVSWPGKPKDSRVAFKTIACSYEFTETFGLQIIEGRDFKQQSLDTVNTEVLITQDAVKTMGLKDPVGTIIKIAESPCVIIGVVNDFHTSSLHETKLPVILYRANYMQTSAIYVKYQQGTTKQSLETLSNAYTHIEPDFTMKYWFQDDTFNELYKTEIISSQLILGFTAIALVIAGIGIIGLSTYNTLRRTKEIGVRRVLGASVLQVLTLLFNEFTFVLIVAICIAGPLAWYAANQWLQGFAYRTAMPWWTFVLAFVGIGLLMAILVGLQGMKTAVAKPSETLRTE
jgi:putative ABC transport system permease protein